MTQQNKIIELAEKSGMIDEFHGFYPSMEKFAQLVSKAKAEELATVLEKGPLNDTAASIAIWIREQ